MVMDFIVKHLWKIVFGVTMIYVFTTFLSMFGVIYDKEYLIWPWEIMTGVMLFSSLVFVIILVIDEWRG